MAKKKKIGINLENDELGIPEGNVVDLRNHSLVRNEPAATKIEPKVIVDKKKNKIDKDRGIIDSTADIDRKLAKQRKE
jgi:hypothetical protein